MKKLFTKLIWWLTGCCLNCGSLDIDTNDYELFTCSDCGVKR